MTDRATADLYDDHADTVQVTLPLFRRFGALDAAAGPIATVKCHEDNSRVREAVSEPGQGRIPVVVPVTIAGVRFEPGAWLSADADGVLVAPEKLG